MTKLPGKTQQETSKVTIQSDSARPHDVFGFILASILFTALWICPLAAHAQGQEEVAQITKSLSGESQKVIERLSGLDNLPAEEWRYHAGDIAHGEAVDLDDAGWQTVKAPSEGSTDAAWYRRWIEVPQSLNGYDLTGARIWFHFRASANGPMPEIIYFNGRRVALGDDLEPVVLFDQAKPAKKCSSR